MSAQNLATILPFAPLRVIHTPRPSLLDDGCPVDDDGWGPGAIPSDPLERAIHFQHQKAIGEDLRRLGVAGRADLFERFELAELAEAVAFVQDQLDAKQRVRNPAGLFVWRLQTRTGRSAFA